MATRKLQGKHLAKNGANFVAEIERTLKKVSEGLEIFHETLEKLDNTSTPAQKEKIEVELKKEIKKLQRLRDLIKGWQALSELKDKQAINEARRNIELEMERFKVLEKEMKIKAYSKEGLSQAAKLDPRENEKLKATQWINSAVDKLGTKTETLEAELEGLQVAARKTKRLDGDKQERLDTLSHTIERHKFHIFRLEKLLRLMENDVYGPDEVNSIKDDVEYYVEANQEPDFVPDETLYDQFNLVGADSDNDDSSLSSSEEESDVEMVPTNGRRTLPSEKDKEREKEKENQSLPTLVTKRNSGGNISSASSSLVNSPPSLPVATTAVSVGKKGLPMVTAKPSSSISSTISPQVILTPMVTIPTQSISNPVIMPKVVGPSFASAIAGPSNVIAASKPVLKTLTPPNMTSTGSVVVSTMVTPHIDGVPGITIPGPYDELYAVIQRHASKPKSSADLLVALELSYQHCPDGGEMEKSRIFTPKQPFTVPAHYPSHPPSILENPAIFERFELDTLFFIFYYQQKTYAQYLAARELKRQSWRFHKKYLTWFQRHEEPKTITDEYEQGTYIYFDYEGNWCQRKKSEFTFEYRYLEDEDTV